MICGLALACTLLAADLTGQTVGLLPGKYDYFTVNISCATGQVSADYISSSTTFPTSPFSAMVVQFASGDLTAFEGADLIAGATWQVIGSVKTPSATSQMTVLRMYPLTGAPTLPSDSVAAVTHTNVFGIFHIPLYRVQEAAILVHNAQLLKASVQVYIGLNR